jgi:hypothetical protein
MWSCASNLFLQVHHFINVQIAPAPDKNIVQEIEDLHSELNASNLKACATIGAVGDSNLPAVSVRYLFDDCQPEAGSLVTGRITRLEHGVSFGFRDT